jgi:hypothetical protein
LKGAINMPHTDPGRGIAEGLPITIVGEADSINIELPPFYPVTTTMRINLSGEGAEASVLSAAAAGQTFKSRISRIEIYGVEPGSDPVGGRAFKATDNVKCTVKIFFTHPEEP